MLAGGCCLEEDLGEVGAGLGFQGVHLASVYIACACKVKRVNVRIPSRTRLIGRRRPNSRTYSPQRQVPIWKFRKTTPAHAGTEFRTPDQRALSRVV